MATEILEALRQRRSRREFAPDPVAMEELEEIIRAGIWAPSGLNNQPWRFVIITHDKTRAELATTTHYSHIVAGAPALIAVYLDRRAMYDEIKDQQAAGACIQNMLLATEALGLGAVWLGQILKEKERVNEILGLTTDYELAAVLAIGQPLHRDQQSNRKDLANFILKRI
ncbi:MAG: nitroreductase [Thermodesulfobacteriota bacterium]